MFLVLSLLFIAQAWAQSLVSPISSESRTNTCLKRTVNVYTSGSSTYVVSNLGSTSFPSQPTLCANASTTTSTVTQCQQPTASAQAVVADSGFEEGQQSPFNTSSSSPSVSASVVQAGSAPAVQPYSGNSFLLITFNNSNPAPPKIKRQASAPQVYNVTQNFAAVAGTSYQLSAYAAQAQNGATPPACSITICGDTSCGASTAISGQYSPYTYQYNAGATNTGAVATFSVSCPQSAYVALDNVTVIAGTAAAASLTPVTTTIIQYITRTQSVPGPIQTETTRQIDTPSTQIYSVTNTISTVLLSTATVVTSVMQTEYVSVNFTVSELSTTTTTITSTLEQTTTINQPPSLIVETATATTTALVTQTDYSVSLLSATPQTLTTSERTTLEVTTTIPGATPPASTQYSTSIVYSTEVSTLYVSVTLPQATQSVQYTLPQATESVTLPQVTYTPAPETTFVTITLPASTITSYISVTPAPVTEFQTITATAPTSTLQITQTLPAETLFITNTQTTSLQAQTLTATLPAQTLTQTAPTQTSIQVQTLTLPGTTLVQTLTLGQSTTRTTTTTTSTTSTTTTSTTTTSTSSSATGPPGVALASPTAIAGDAVNGSPSTYDDNTFPITLPFAVSLYGQSNANVVVSSNGLLGLGSATNSYDNAALPQYNAVNTGVLGFWEDLIILQGTKQGIYYQVSGTASARTVSFEFYLSDYNSGGTQYYHFLVIFYENRPNVVTLKYLQVSDRGQQATVGVQSSSAGNKFKQYSNFQSIIYPGLQITIDTSPANGNGLLTVDSPGTP